MSRAGVPLALILLWTAACPAAAQEAGPAPRPGADRASDVEADLVRRIETLLPKARAAAARARETERVRDSIQRARNGRVETASLRVGPLRVVTLPGQEARARRFLSSELERLGPLARSAERSLAEVTIVFQYAPVLETIQVDGPAETVAVRRLWGDRAVRNRVRDVLGARVTRSLPAPVRFWLGNRSIRVHGEPTHLHRTLVLDGSLSATACAQGDLEACWASFGLSGSPSPVGEWYTPRQARAFARVRDLGAWLECTASPAVPGEVCDEDLVSSERRWTRAIPFGHDMRADLVAFALELGGAGALDRLRAGWPTGPDGAMGRDDGRVGVTLIELGTRLRARLAAAAGMPPDQLMRRWRERVVLAEPASRRGFDDRTRLATGFWILFFAVLATRSTRWRLG